MPSIPTRTFSPLDLAGAAFSSPLFSLIIALVAAGGIALIASRPGRGSTRLESGEFPASVRTRYAPEHRALGVAALWVTVVFIAELVIRGHVITDQTLWWWRFAVPITCAIVGVCVVFGLIVTRGTTSAEAPVLPAVRRTWASFSSRSLLMMAGLTFVALLATTVAAGIASSPNGAGQYVWLTIPIPNEPGIDPIRLPFYGWAYGAPVLVALTVLVAVTWATLDRNAARTYLRPETIAPERVARRETARNTTLIATAAALLTLAGAWRLIASAGSGSFLTITGQNADAPYDAAWRFSELAVAAGWCAPILEVTAFAVLLLIAADGLRPRTAMHSSAPSEAPSNADALR